jgi:hypothetical protein
MSTKPAELRRYFAAEVIREAGGGRSGVTGGTTVLSDRIIVRISAGPGESFLDKMIGNYGDSAFYYAFLVSRLRDNRVHCHRNLIECTVTGTPRVHCHHRNPESALSPEPRNLALSPEPCGTLPPEPCESSVVRGLQDAEL